MKLSIDKKVLKDYLKTHPELAEAMKELFPELRKDEKFFDLSPAVRFLPEYPAIFSDGMAQEMGFEDRSFLQIRTLGEYANRGFFLDSRYQWKIVMDDWDMLVLLPLKEDENKNGNKPSKSSVPEDYSSGNVGIGYTSPSKLDIPDDSVGDRRAE